MRNLIIHFSLTIKALHSCDHIAEVHSRFYIFTFQSYLHFSVCKVNIAQTIVPCHLSVSADSSKCGTITSIEQTCKSFYFTGCQQYADLTIKNSTIFCLEYVTDRNNMIWMSWIIMHIIITTVKIVSGKAASKLILDFQFPWSISRVELR